MRRYRVEQVVRLESFATITDEETGELSRGMIAAEGRVRFQLTEERYAQGPPLFRFSEVTVERPTVTGGGELVMGMQAAMAMGLESLRRLEGREVEGDFSALPVFPLGESDPPWLTAWLRWAQTGNFSGIEGSPVALPGAKDRDKDNDESKAENHTASSYQIKWLRTETRGQQGVLCHVQQSRWSVPVQEAPGSLSPALAEKGVVARTYFAGQSLEWIAQNDPYLVFAERSAVRETFWDLSSVQDAELLEQMPTAAGRPFRMRLTVQVRVEHLP